MFKFQDKYRTARRQAASQSITQLQKIISEAVQTLREVMNDKEIIQSDEEYYGKTYQT